MLHVIAFDLDGMKKEEYCCSTDYRERRKKMFYFFRKIGLIKIV